MKKSYQTIGLILLVAGLLVWWYVPQLQVDQLNVSMNNTVERANLENQYRVTIIQTLGGLVVIAGLFFTYEKIITLKDGQVTERFTNAIEQLGKDQLELKLGGIYALERIANESESDYWPIMEILTAYVRKNSSAEIADNKKITSLDMDIQANESITREDLEAKEASLEIQTVLTVLGRRKKSYNDSEVNNLHERYKKLFNNRVGHHLYKSFNEKEENRLNLRGTCLQEIDLEGAHLEGANLRKANLRKANLRKANLRETNFREADLEGAKLEGTNLSGAKLEGANLKSTHLKGANLEGANLSEANLEGANLKSTHLKGANLSGANLEGANLRFANLEGTYFGEIQLVSYEWNSKWDSEWSLFRTAYRIYTEWTNDLEGANLKGANLEETNLEDANLKGVNLEKANLEGANLKGANISRANLEGANILGANLRFANINGANIREAYLGGANLRFANINGANLEGANLEEANLGGANLKFANLKFANLKGANIRGANLEGANLSGAKNLSLDLLSNVKTLYNSEIDRELFIKLKEKHFDLFEKPNDKRILPELPPLLFAFRGLWK